MWKSTWRLKAWFTDTENIYKLFENQRKLTLGVDDKL